MIDSRYSGLTRRQILRRLAGGAGLLGLAGVMQQKGGRAYGANPSLNLQGNLPARARRVIFLFLNGGPSHVDTFDPKPALLKYEGQKPEGKLYREGKKGGFMPSPFKFTRHGENGIEFSESVPHLAGLADDVCLVRSMHTDVPNHEPALLQMHGADSDACIHGAGKHQGANGAAIPASRGDLFVLDYLHRLAFRRTS